MSAFVGFNIHARNIKNKSRLYAHIQATRPRACVVMDDHSVALEIKALSPETLVSFRVWGSDGDENDYLQMTPREWLDSHKKFAVNGIALYVLNEPPFNPQVMTWLVELVKLNITEYGFTLIIGNWATGNPSGDNIPQQWAIARELLELADKHRDKIMIGLHQYAGAVVTSGLMGGNPNRAGAKSVNLIPRANWPERMMDEDGNPISRFHIGREFFLVQYCQSVGLKPPRIIITEGIFDDVKDLDSWLKALPVTPPYANVRGYKTLRYQWAAWFPDWSLARAFFEQLKYAVEVIWKDSPVEAVCLYCYGHSSNQWQQFDIEGEEELLTLLEQYAQEQAPMNALPLTNDPRWLGAENRSGSDYRVRLHPFRDDQKELDWIRKGARFYYIPLNGDFMYGKSIGGVIGYVHKDVLRVESPPPPPPPVIPPIAQDIEILDVLIRQAEEEWSTVNHALAKIDARLKLLRTLRDNVQLRSDKPATAA